MPYTDKQRRYFGAVASGDVKDSNLSAHEAEKMLKEGKKEGWISSLKKRVKKETKKYRRKRHA